MEQHFLVKLLTVAGSKTFLLKSVVPCNIHFAIITGAKRQNCWQENVACLLYYCRTLPLSYFIDQDH